jgi:hypothetical protein
MRTTIDSAGRLVIPKRIRDRLGLRGNEHWRSRSAMLGMHNVTGGATYDAGRINDESGWSTCDQAAVTLRCYRRDQASQRSRL